MSLLQHLYEGECPDNWTGPQARDIRCPACRALDAPVGLVVEIDRPAGQQPIARIYRDEVLVFDGVSSLLLDVVGVGQEGTSRVQVTAVVVQRTGRHAPAAPSTGPRLIQANRAGAA